MWPTFCWPHSERAPFAAVDLQKDNQTLEAMEGMLLEGISKCKHITAEASV